MKGVWLGVGFAAMLAVSQPGWAQQVRGDNEIQVQGSLSLSTQGAQQSSGSAVAKYGRFLTDYQQVGLDLTASITGYNKISGSGGPFYRYNFSNGKLVPYLGASIAGSFGNSGAGFGKGGELDVEGGFRYFLDRRTAFTASAQARYSFDNSGFYKTIDLLFGFSHLWGR